MRRPSRRAESRAGSPPRRMRRVRNSAPRMRWPAMGAAERAMAGEGGERADHGFDFGEFGHSGNLDIDVAALHFDFESGHAFGGVVIVLAGGAIEFPKVVGADDAAIVNLALAERAALMEAHAAEGVDSPAGMAYGVGSIAHHH